MIKKYFLNKGVLRDQIISSMAKFAADLNPEKNWIVSITDKSPTRTTVMNGLYWTLVTVIANELGYTKEEMHDLLKVRYLIPILLRDDPEFSDLWGKVLAASGGDIHMSFVNLISTRELSVKQFSEYLKDVEHFASGKNIRLPSLETGE